MIATEYDKMIIQKSIEEAFRKEIFINKKIIIFGCTMYARDIKCTLENHSLRVYSMIDNNLNKVGKECMGLNVYLPQEYLVPYHNDYIIIICSKYGYEMRKQLEKLGYFDSQIFEISIAESVLSMGDGIEALESAYAEILEGVDIYNKLKEKYSEKHNFLLCIYPGTGDVYMACCYLDEYSKKNKVEKYILCVVGNSCKKTASLFGVKDIEVFAAEEMQLLLKVWEFLGNENVDIKPLLYWGWRTKKFLFADRHKQITFNEMFQFDVFGLEEGVEKKRPIRIRDSMAMESFFREKRLIPGRTIIIAPYAGSFVSEIKMSVWERIASELNKKGYVVCTNCVGENEKPIPKTIPLFFSYVDAHNVLEMAGGFIAIRSGLCDIVSDANCHKLVIYESGFNASSYDYFSLEKMGLSDDILEIVYEKGSEESFVKMLIKYFEVR